MGKATGLENIFTTGDTREHRGNISPGNPLDPALACSLGHTLLEFLEPFRRVVYSQDIILKNEL